MKYCDNKNSVHENIIINQNEDGLRTYCKQCKQINILRCEKNGRFSNRQYSQVFKRDLLQEGENLYYKYNSHKMSIL